MKRTYITAQGKQISMDSIRLANEEVIAVGNQKVNARGDSLGPGGVPQKTKQQAVNQYYNLHTPTAGAQTGPSKAAAKPAPVEPPVPSADPLIDEQDAVELPPKSQAPKMRGNLADEVAKSTRNKK